jgi:hypothetical protein
MADLWDKDEDADINEIEKMVLHVQTKEQIKRKEERRLVEESDIALINSLFVDNKQPIKKEIKCIEKKETKKPNNNEKVS